MFSLSSTVQPQVSPAFSRFLRPFCDCFPDAAVESGFPRRSSEGSDELSVSRG